MIDTVTIFIPYIFFDLPSNLERILIIVDCGGEICYHIFSFFIGNIDKSLDFRIVPEKISLYFFRRIIGQPALPVPGVKALQPFS